MENLAVRRLSRPGERSERPGERRDLGVGVIQGEERVAGESVHIVARRPEYQLAYDFEIPGWIETPLGIERRARPVPLGERIRSVWWALVGAWDVQIPIGIQNRLSI